MKIFCFDPGEHTGYGVLEVYGAFGDDPARYIRPLHSGVWVAEPANIAVKAHSLLAEHRSDEAVFVIEKFTAGAGGEMQSLTNRVIGALEAVAVLDHRVKDCYLQPNFMRTRALPMAKTFDSQRHAVDAIAHGIIWATKHTAFKLADSANRT